MEQEVWTDGTGNYLKIRGEGEETLADRMFRYQDISGFLPMELIRIDGQKDYIYDISGKISLARYLSGNEITRERLQDIVREILMLSDTVQEYLLDGNGVVCHEEYIYIDRSSGQVNGIYQEQSPYGDVKAFGSLLETVMQTMNAGDESLAFFVYGMHKLTKEVGMTRRILLEYAAKEREEQPLKTVVSTDRKREEKRITQSGIVQTETPKLNERAAFVFSGLLAAFGILLTVLAWYFGWFQQPVSGETDVAMGIGTSLFFLGISGYGAWKIGPFRRLSDVVWEGESRSAKACLISCQGKIESIPIVHCPFILGAEKERVDGIIAASGIEAIHAQMFCEGNDFYVQDEDSRQGTYHNGERLVAGYKRRLQDGDILCLAETEFVVEIS